MTSSPKIRITWLGHSTFRIQTAQGKTIVIDPWLVNNPSCPEELKSLSKFDLLLLTHGHFDHFEDALALAREHRPHVVSNFEICQYMELNGVENTHPMNKGGTQTVEGIEITMVSASHTSSIRDGDRILPAGEPVGFVLKLENGFKIYDAGDTAVFGDMKLIGDLYRPDLVLLPIGDLFTMGPREAALACRLIGANKVIPKHFGTFPILAGTPAALREQTRDIAGLQIITLEPGQTWS